MFKAPALALASFLLIATPAIAQRSAPITQGVTSSDLAQQVTQARQQSAQLKVEVNGLTGDVMQLTGRVETLGFELQQARDENAALLRDNEALADEIQDLRDQMDMQAETIASLQAYLAAAGVIPEVEQLQAPSSYPDTERYEDAGQTLGSSARTIVNRPVASSGSGPRRITATTEPDRNAVEGTGADALAAVPAGDNGSLPQGSLGTLPASALPGEAGPLFATAKSKLIQFDYAGAEAAFRKFLDEFGDDPQAGEAHYWLGEALYQQKAYADSGAAYTTMIRSYPEDPRAADALVKLARAMRLIGEKEKACLALNTLPGRYPNASNLTQDLAAVERTKSGCDNQ